MSALAKELIQPGTGRTARKGGCRPPPAPRITDRTYIDDRPRSKAERCPGTGKATWSSVRVARLPSRRWSSGPPDSIVPLHGRDSIAVGARLRNSRVVFLN